MKLANYMEVLDFYRDKKVFIKCQILKSNDSIAINVGYMVLDSKIFNYIKGDNTIFETDVLEKLARDGELMSYEHKGFWQCMDTLLEKNTLEELWASGNAALEAVGLEVVIDIIKRGMRDESLELRGRSKERN